MVGQTLSHYKVIEKLGEGGMGVVYKAQDLKLDRFVALKFLPASITASEQEVTRFEQEAKAISTLNHPNIATIHDIEEVEGKKFLVLEYLQGGTLRTKIKQLTSEGKELSAEEIIEYGVQIAEGLGHAHKHGIIHRDMKSDNVMLTEDGKVKITDFGLAKVHGSAQLTRSGTTVGTAAYMAPEQVLGGELDHRCDLFSLGIILYELATGRLPFRGEHEVALSYSIVHEEPAPISSFRPDLPAALESIILRCLVKDREQRFQNGDEIAKELRNVLRGTSTLVSVPTPSKVQKVFEPRWKSFVGYGIGTVVVLVGLIFLYHFVVSKLLAGDRKSIAVLPFANLSEDKEYEYFSDGITEDIITQLSRIVDLRVISRTSVMRYKKSDKSLQEISRDLDVATVLEGSVRRAGNRLRVISQLIDPKTEEHLWGDTYERELKDIFDIQSDIAEKIATALGARLLPAEKQKIEKKQTANLTAYEYYLKGRQYYYLYRKPDNEKAIEQFMKAITLDPNYALAYGGLGDAYVQRTDRFGFSEVWRDSAFAAVKKAISIDPELAEAYKAMGAAYQGKGFVKRSREAYRKAVDLNPNYAPAVGNLGFTSLLFGQLDEAITWMKKAAKLSPDVAFNVYTVGVGYSLLRDHARATEWFNKSLQLQPEFGYAIAGLGYVSLEDKKYQEGFERAKKILSIDSSDIVGLALLGDLQLALRKFTEAESFYRKAIALDSSTRAWTGIFPSTSLGYISWKKGQRDEALRMLNLSLRLDQSDLDQGYEWYVVPLDIAVVHAIQGHRTEALKWLDKAVAAGWRDYDTGLLSPQLENLRNDEQFKKMMAQLKTKVDEMRIRVEAVAQP